MALWFSLLITYLWSDVYHSEWLYKSHALLLLSLENRWLSHMKRSWENPVHASSRQPPIVHYVSVFVDVLVLNIYHFYFFFLRISHIGTVFTSFPCCTFTPTAPAQVLWPWLPVNFMISSSLLYTNIYTYTRAHTYAHTLLWFPSSSDGIYRCSYSLGLPLSVIQMSPLSLNLLLGLLMAWIFYFATKAKKDTKQNILSIKNNLWTAVALSFSLTVLLWVCALPSTDASLKHFGSCAIWPGFLGTNIQ